MKTGLFVKEFFRTYRTTGAICPSSRALAKALVSPLDTIPSPRRILEAGPGTGVVSDALIQKLNEGDQLTLCEINPRFHQHLLNQLDQRPAWSRRRKQIEILQEDVRKVLQPQSYDLIVSGLPLTNFDKDFVKELMEGFLSSLAPGGVHTFFEYQAIRFLRSHFDRKVERQRLIEINQVIDQSLKNHLVQYVPIYMNIPPAWAILVYA